jgi:hypothetical protein
MPSAGGLNWKEHPGSPGGFAWSLPSQTAWGAGPFRAGQRYWRAHWRATRKKVLPWSAESGNSVIRIGAVSVDVRDT